MQTFRDVIANWKNSASYSESGRRMYTQAELNNAIKDERDRYHALLREFFEIYNADGVTFWVDYTPDNDAHDIYKRFQKWKAAAIRKLENQ